MWKQTYDVPRSSRAKQDHKGKVFFFQLRLFQLIPFGAVKAWTKLHLPPKSEYFFPGGDVLQMSCPPCVVLQHSTVPAFRETLFSVCLFDGLYL